MQPFNSMVFLILFPLMLSMASQVACICFPSVRAWAEDKYLRVPTPRVLPAYRKAKEAAFKSRDERSVHGTCK